MHAHDLAGIARIAAASRVLIGADEDIHSPDDIERHHAAKAAHGVSLKAIKLGGVQRVFDASRLCDRLGMKLNISCKTGEFSVASAAALHLAAVVPSLAWGLTVTSPGLAEDVVTDPLRIDSGHMNGAGPARPRRRGRRAPRPALAAGIQESGISRKLGMIRRVVTGFRKRSCSN